MLAPKSSGRPWRIPRWAGGATCWLCDYPKRELCQRAVTTGDPIGRVTVLSRESGPRELRGRSMRLKRAGRSSDSPLERLPVMEIYGVPVGSVMPRGRCCPKRYHSKFRVRWQETVRRTAQLVYINSVAQEQRGNRAQAGGLVSGKIGCDVMVVEGKAANCACKQPSAKRRIEGSTASCG
jgi:hypothetical protein